MFPLLVWLRLLSLEDQCGNTLILGGSSRGFTLSIHIFIWNKIDTKYSVVHSNAKFDVQGKGTDKILYGIDDISDAAEIIIVNSVHLFFPSLSSFVGNLQMKTSKRELKIFLQSCDDHRLKGKLISFHLRRLAFKIVLVFQGVHLERFLQKICHQ